MRSQRPDGSVRASARIAVFRALQLGDMLCVVPALRSLRAGCPKAEIVLVGLPWAREFARRFERYIDRFVAFPGHPAMPEQKVCPEGWPAYLEAVRARRFDLALQLHGSGRLTNRLIADWGAVRTAGFHPPDESAADANAYLAWDEREHEVRRYVRLMKHLGMPDRGLHLEWPDIAGDGTVSQAVSCAIGRRAYVVLHPGARMRSRRWPVERFASVGDRLAALGYAVLVTGANDEKPLAQRLREAMGAPALDLAGKTSLAEVATIVKHASLLVCNDTGVSHLAAAVGTPSVVVCCGADPQRWAPLDASRHAVVYQPMSCRPCMHTVCPIGHPCATEVTADAVAERAVRMLERRGAPVPLSEAMP